MSGGGARVSIPAGVRRTIQNIKEIAGNHSDEEIYAMLKECSMDPNETTQKLLLQGLALLLALSPPPLSSISDSPFSARMGVLEMVSSYELSISIREIDLLSPLNVREPAEPRWRPGMQGRGGRGGRGNYSSRSLPNDTTAGRNATSGKESGLNQGIDKAQTSISTTPDTENKPALSSSVSGIVNGPSNIEHPVSSQGSNVSGVDGAPSEANSDAVTTKTTNPRLPSKDAKGGSAPGQLQRDMDQFSSNKLVMVPSTDTHTPSELGTTKQIKPHGSVTDEPVEKSQVASSSSGPLGSRPSSTYNNRFQHPSAPLANKEWKPKSVLANPAQASETNDTSEVPVVIEAVSQPLLTLSLTTPKGVSVNLAKKVEELKLSDRQHVIIPNHLQVPESERHGLSFGSFDANFEFNTVLTKDTMRDNIETPPYESSQETDETIEKHSLSNNATSSAAEEDDFSEHPQLSEQVTESYSVKEIVASNITSPEKEYNEANQEDNLAPESSQNVVLQSMPSYPPVGLVPQLGSHIASFEGSDSHARDIGIMVQNFVHFPRNGQDEPFSALVEVQQPYDPSTSYFNPFYRPSPDADGRISPFFASGASTRYNGNIALLPAQAGQASQENTNPIVLPTVGSTPLGTQASGTMQGSLAIPQQSVPVFRQPAGLHISHYSPNYIPYSQYFSPFYPPPPAVHHFLSSAAFPQQPLTGGMYPSPGAATPAAAAAVKYSLPQYKPGSNTGNSTIVGLPNVYGSYNSTQAGYTSVPAVSTGNSTTNEELGSSQFKENNVYISGQQSEGPPVWIPAPGRDMSSLQASSFYNIPQGQHMTFTPTQAGHGAFSGIYPPTPAVPNSVHPLLQQSQTVAGAVEMLAPPTDRRHGLAVGSPDVRKKTKIIAEDSWPCRPKKLRSGNPLYTVESHNRRNESAMLMYCVLVEVVVIYHQSIANNCSSHTSKPGCRHIQQLGSVSSNMKQTMAAQDIARVRTDQVKQAETANGLSNQRNRSISRSPASLRTRQRSDPHERESGLELCAAAVAESICSALGRLAAASKGRKGKELENDQLKDFFLSEPMSSKAATKRVAASSQLALAASSSLLI
ncbi:hypothetical protein ZIOFF_072488 [Zingiber officinale]|uniref:GBF-interacting protein 1 N-terminal domain-containing protein n=1 Tax=Zingiber officinale TaxID=94328 RepID=A0A8J5ELS8_ZINOF|nr:hypothetical protein ZIOFF_072488 [Zingiber officinale]